MNMHKILQQDPEIWDLFTRKEEYNPINTDSYGRFPYYASTYRNIFEPKVSEYLISRGLSCEYPDHHPFCVCLTHDIDIVYKSAVSKFLDTARYLKSGNVTHAAQILPNIRSKRIPWWNFKMIMDLEEKYGAKSSFYFMAPDLDDADNKYPIEDLAPEMGIIIDRGFEVGLHGSRKASLSLEQIVVEKDRLEKTIGHSVTGYRNHYLYFKVPETWVNLAKAGFHYDTTVGYADCIGFRNGMCHPYKPFNLNTNQEIDILEIPLNLMDNTLGPTYMRLEPLVAWDLIKRLIDTVERNHGIFTILWHNTYMEGANLKMYEKILKYCYNKNAWLVDGNSNYNWWIKNGRH